MVKFGKYFASHLVPEWRPAFCDYRSLKKELKRIKITSQDCVYAALRGPTLQNIRACSSDDVILVHKKLSPHHGSRVDLVETELLSNTPQADGEKQFFQSLDAELNKVIEFYKNKEKDFFEHAEILDEQMRALFELKLRTGNRKSSTGSVKSQCAVDDELTEPLKGNLLNTNSIDVMDSAVLLHNEILFQTVMSGKHATTRKGAPSVDHLSSIKERLRDIDGLTPPDRGLHLTRGYMDTDTQQGFRSSSPDNVSHARGVSDDVSHASTVWNGRRRNCCNLRELHAFKAKIQRSEKMLCEAFVEFYRGLGLLRTYRILNVRAFTKILKKYEKVTERSVSSTYMRTVDCSYFRTSEKVTKLIIWVEAMFTDYFAHGDRRQARKALKPPQAEARPQITFLLGGGQSFSNQQ